MIGFVGNNLKFTRALGSLALTLAFSHPGRAQIIEGRNSGIAEPGSTLEVEDDEGETLVYHLVGAVEADPTTGRISVESPVGRALVGKRAGDRISVEVPAGLVQLTIKTVS